MYVLMYLRRKHIHGGISSTCTCKYALECTYSANLYPYRPTSLAQYGSLVDANEEHPLFLGNLGKTGGLPFTVVFLTKPLELRAHGARECG
jgi:hypothetical protein